jgi:hypothetical protein
MNPGYVTEYNAAVMARYRESDVALEDYADFLSVYLEANDTGGVTPWFNGNGLCHALGSWLGGGRLMEAYDFIEGRMLITGKVDAAGLPLAYLAPCGSYPAHFHPVRVAWAQAEYDHMRKVLGGTGLGDPIMSKQRRAARVSFHD